jgi:hypothetical protein
MCVGERRRVSFLRNFLCSPHTGLLFRAAHIEESPISGLVSFKPYEVQQGYPMLPEVDDF